KADRKAAAKEALCKNQEFLESQKKGYSDPTYDYKAGYPRPDEAWAFDANGNIDKEKSAEVSEKIGEWSTYACHTGSRRTINYWIFSQSWRKRWHKTGF
ncbi:hypothetical protein, partial [Listeria innocua]|uniref:hypothetical protein n=1 Tax=Listeria innocua TaxID=1642 RepID=UPI001C8CDF1C